MVVCRDNSVLAQLGTPDMRVPIAIGLSFPERIESGARRLELQTLGALSCALTKRGRLGSRLCSWRMAAPGAEADQRISVSSTTTIDRPAAKPVRDLRQIEVKFDSSITPIVLDGP
jgi:1-deoxy-D-xylulose 5-phosphate reductoisomerase